MAAGAQLVLALKWRGRVIPLEERAEGHLFAYGGGWPGTSLQGKIRMDSERDMLYSLYGLCPYLAEQEKCSLTGLKIDRAAFLCVRGNLVQGGINNAGAYKAAKSCVQGATTPAILAHLCTRLLL